MLTDREKKRCCGNSRGNENVLPVVVTIGFIILLIGPCLSSVNKSVCPISPYVVSYTVLLTYGPSSTVKSAWVDGDCMKEQ